MLKDRRLDFKPPNHPGRTFPTRTTPTCLRVNRASRMTDTRSMLSQRAATVATPAPRAAREQKEARHPEEHQHGGREHRQPTAHLFLVVVVVLATLAALALAPAAAAIVRRLARRGHRVGQFLEAEADAALVRIHPDHEQRQLVADVHDLAGSGDGTR